MLQKSRTMFGWLIRFITTASLRACVAWSLRWSFIANICPVSMCRTSSQCESASISDFFS